MYKAAWKWLGVVVILGLVLASCPVSIVSAEPTIIDVDTIWDEDQFPQSDVVIQDGATLVIASGVTVYVSCTDSGDYSVSSKDLERIEFIVESGGRLEVEGAKLAATDLYTENCWYGVDYQPGSSGFIKNSTIQNAIIGVYIEDDIEVSNTTIHHLFAPDAEAPGDRGEISAGILIDAAGTSPTIQSNLIESIYGGDGWDASPGEEASSAGSAFGIVAVSGSPVISGNTVQLLEGGTGGDGGDGIDGLPGDDAVDLGSSGSAGGVGTQGDEGRTGGMVVGIYLLPSAGGSVVTGNNVNRLYGGDGGDGGIGGDGGNGGSGAAGAGDSTGLPGGDGGDGGDGMVGGNGGSGASVMGIRVHAGSVTLTRNTVSRVYAGNAGIAGEGGDGGDGGLGGVGGEGISDYGGNGGNGGQGGNAGRGGLGGGGGPAYLVYSDEGGFSEFSRNSLSDGVAGIGGDGGNGGLGGDGGLGGAGGYGPTQSGVGGNGGTGGAGGEGAWAGYTGESYGIYFFALTDVPTSLTNNIIYRVFSSGGGSPGTGSNGGTGGDGGAGTPDGDGGNGGDAGDGGNGGSSALAVLLRIVDTDLNVVNNTFYWPETEDPGVGGEAGLPGDGGLGTSIGESGASGTPGETGYAYKSICLRAFKQELTDMTVNVYNNVFASAAAAQGDVAIQQANTGTTINTDYNAFNNLLTTFDFVDVPPTPGNDYSGDPDFVDEASYNFHLAETSPLIDAGNNAAVGVPSTDFDGNARPQDGDDDTLIIVDMGAYELSNAILNFIPLFLR